jgi:Ser/Thr protein kinase RdoA (MazF antagonist)
LWFSSLCLGGSILYFMKLAAIASSFGIRLQQSTPITSGLINHTYQITDSSGTSYLLQQINTRIFPEPQKVQENFAALQAILQYHYRMPAMLPTAENTSYLQHTEDNTCWRCFTFVENSFTPTGSINEELAYTTAKCFGAYTSLLSKAAPVLHTILPRFHDLNLRAEQLLQAKSTATQERLNMAGKWLSKLDAYAYLLKHFAYWQQHPQHYPPRILHHDAKASNILFDSQTHQLICPIDLDTTQTGLFFSDLGDMIRSMVPSHEENDTRFDDIEARASFLEAITSGYLDATHTLWTKQEMEALALSGKVLLYMQAIRFLADYLNNDSYYQTKYEQHNLDRAINQMTVLEMLEKK